MRFCLILIVSLLALTVAAGDEPMKPIGPEEAAKRVNEQVSLQMEVKSATLRGELCFLNSEPDFKDAKNFTIFIGREGLKKFKEAKIEDPASHFNGKTVRVTGKVVLFREKPQIAVDRPDQVVLVGDPSAPDVKQDMARLEGEWSMVSGEIDGQQLPEESRQGAKRVAKAGETTVTINGEIFMKAKFTIDPRKKPKTIDYLFTEGPTKGKRQLGIYELDGDTVKFCFSGPDKERPSEFSTQEGSNRTLSVWKRNGK